MTTVNGKLFEGQHVISNLTFERDGGKGFFKTFTMGLENRTDDFFWDKYRKKVLTKVQNRAMSILAKAGSHELSEISSPVKALFQRIVEQATDLSRQIIDTMKANIHVADFAKFCQTLNKLVTGLENTYLDAKDYLSLQLDNILDGLLHDLFLLLAELKDLFRELLLLLYDITIPIAPNMGKWGLKGTFGVTILDMVFEFEGEIISSDEDETPCHSRYSDFYAYLGKDKTLRVLGQVSSWNLQSDAIIWGLDFWTYLTPAYESKLEIALSTERKAFVSRMMVGFNLMGLNATAELFVSTKGVRCTAEGNIWKIFPGRLTVGAEYTQQPEDWKIWITGDFLRQKEDTFNARLMDHITKAVRNTGENAKRRLAASENSLFSAENGVIIAKTTVESSKKKAIEAESALNAAIVRLDTARKLLEKAREVGESSDGVLGRICQRSECKSVCTRRLTWGRYCEFWWSVRFPCFTPIACAALILDPKCVTANAVCRKKRALIPNDPRFTAASSGLNLEKAEVDVIVAEINVNASRNLFEFYKSNHNGAMAGLQVAKDKVTEAGAALENLKQSLQPGVELLDALTNEDFYTYMEVGNCSFNISLSEATETQLDVDCNINFLSTGWVESKFVLDLKNIAGSLWRVANGFVTEVMERLQPKRKRRNVESLHRLLLHNADRRNTRSVTSGSMGEKGAETDLHFWQMQCLAYVPNTEFIRTSLQFLHNMTYKVRKETSVTQQNVSSYFEELNVEFHLNRTKFSQTHNFPPEYDIPLDVLDLAIQNMKVTDDDVTRALASSLGGLWMIQKRIIQAYINNKVIVLWKTEMQSYTQRTFQVNNDCFGFTDCILYALGQVGSMINSVDYSLVERYAVSFAAFEQSMYDLIENEGRTTEETGQLSAQLLDDFPIADASEIFCATMPTIRTPPLNATIVETENVTLTCEVDSIPEPFFAWYKDGDVIPDANQPFLTILNSVLEHEGYYRCVAENHIGQASSTLAFLNVLFSPKLEANLPEALSLSPGDHLSLICNVSANPGADVLWYSSNSLSPVSTGKTLLLGDLPDNTFALYKCVANNTYGTVESSETAVLVKSKTPSCPALKMQVGYASRLYSVGETVLLPLIPASSNLTRIFESAFVMTKNSTSPQVEISVAKINEMLKLIDITVAHLCTNLSVCFSDGCKLQYVDMSSDLNHTVNRLLQLAEEQAAMFVKGINVVHLLSGTAKTYYVESHCQAGYTKLSDGLCGE